jgi:hypothetical protein
VTIRSEGETMRELVSAGKFSLRAKIPVLPADAVLVFNKETPVVVSIGEWRFEGVLGDDPKFVPEKSRSVRIPLSGGGSLAIAASPKAFTASISGKTGSNAKGDQFEVSPTAAGLYSEESKKISLADEIATDVTIQVGGVNAVARIPLTGKIRYSLKKIGRGDTAEEFGLNRVQVSGKGLVQRVVED